MISNASNTTTRSWPGGRSKQLLTKTVPMAGCSSAQAPPTDCLCKYGCKQLRSIASQGLEWLAYHVQTSYNWLGPATVGMPVLLWPQWHAHSTNRTSHLSASRGTQHLHVSLRQMSTTHEHQYSLLMLPSYVAIFIYTGFYDRINQRINCHSSDENNAFFFFFSILMTNKLNKYQP